MVERRSISSDARLSRAAPSTTNRLAAMPLMIGTPRSQKAATDANCRVWLGDRTKATAIHAASASMCPICRFTQVTTSRKPQRGPLPSGGGGAGGRHERASHSTDVITFSSRIQRQNEVTTATAASDTYCSAQPSWTPGGVVDQIHAPTVAPPPASNRTGQASL